jgi:hypothetical protein
LLRIRWCGSAPAELPTWVYYVFLFLDWFCKSFFLGYTWTVCTWLRGDAAHWLLTATGSPPGLAARGRKGGCRAPAGSRSWLAPRKMVRMMLNFLNMIPLARRAVPQADPVLRLRSKFVLWFVSMVKLYCVALVRWLRIHLCGSAFRNKENNFFLNCLLI